MDGKDPNISSQDSAYRRGLVLGLTMAEIMVLILFTLLLALAAISSTEKKILQDKDHRIAQLEIFEREVKEMLRDSPEGITVTDIVQRLERRDNEISALKQEVEKLRVFESAAKALDDIIREIKRSETVTPAQIVKELESARQLREQIAALQKENDQLKARETNAHTLGDHMQSLTKDNENLKGQLAQLSKQIKSQGRGNEFPSCWATPEGKTESIFELVITPNGIAIKDRKLPHRAKDKERLPLASAHYGVELPLNSFQAQLRPLYNWSVENHCRFYVIMYSTVPSASVQLVNAANSYFYPDSPIRLRPGGL